MTSTNPVFTIRSAQESDMPFVQSLSPLLAQQAGLDWHDDKAVKKFQDEYIAAMMAQTCTPHITLIAEHCGMPVGFVHARERTDEISEETSGTVPLLAIAEGAQGSGAGGQLMEAVEEWSKAQGYRLLHLEVFSANTSAQRFYRKQGFLPEVVHMIKPLD